MKTVFTEEGWEDYLWAQTDPEMLRRLNRLITDVQRSPFQGIGKPEPLKGDLGGWWSRRITGDHRLVYRISGKGEDQIIEIVACRYHY